LFVYLISLTGKDFWLLKSIGFAGFVWVLGIGLLDRIFKLVPALYNDAPTNLALLASDLVYSISMAYFVVRWSDFPRNIINRS